MGTEHDGWIYIVGAVGAGMVKIGFTRNPPTRIKALRADAAWTLLVLRLVPGSVSDERALHRRFAEHRDHGEWFRLTAGSSLDVFIREDLDSDMDMALHCEDFNEAGDWGRHVA
jgi:hypothetical protein